MSVPKVGTVGLLILASSMGCESVEVDYHGYNTAQEALGFTFQKKGLPLLIQEQSGQRELSLKEESDPELNGMMKAKGGSGGHLMVIENFALISNVPMGEGGSPLSFGLSGTVAQDYGEYVSEELIPRDYLWLRLGDCQSTDLAWGFVSFDATSYRVREVGPPLDMEDMATGEGTVSSEMADSSGSWEMDPDELGHLLLSGKGGEQEAWTLPGQVIVMTQPEGLLVAVANPSSHLSVLKAAGVYKFLDIECNSEGEMDLGVGNFVIFDQDVSLVRYSQSGDEVREEGMLGFHKNVGSGFGLLSSHEGGPNVGENSSYFALAGEIGLIFGFGDTQRAGVALRLGIAGL